MPNRTAYDIIIIGGGHAGAEAAWAAANMLRPLHADSDGQAGQIALITMDPSKIGAMSCNPAIGGLAKGQMVREVDALGGLMALAADATGIQFKVLNASKGPAVRGPRCQSDKYRYAREVQRLLATRPNLHILAGTVDDIHTDDTGRCTGVTFQHHASDVEHHPFLSASAVILTTGTFMRGLMHTGPTKTEGGRVGEGSATGISGCLRQLGFDLGRLKTGTPPRLAAESLDLDSLDRQPGDECPLPFSDMTLAPIAPPTDLPEHDREAYARVADGFPVVEQRPCWITHTSRDIHDAILANLDRAPMYNGDIEADCGPRYCPSIEDKVKRFEDRDSHHVFLEPESLDTNEIYCNGISTSLPQDVQDVMVRGLPGCEHARILRYGYAVEYDMVWPHQIDATCMTKHVPGLFLAGQINGTSGYEEAAGQGLMAGVNAVLYAQQRLGLGGQMLANVVDAADATVGLSSDGLLRLGREQAYIGVLLDDLVTKTPREPYRMFTSRAEHRLLLRPDNADARLTPLAEALGLVDDWRQQCFEQHQQASQQLRDYLQTTYADGALLSKWALRPQVSEADVVERLRDTLPQHTLTPRVVTTVMADLLYAGYIQRSEREMAKLREQEATALSVPFDYQTITGLRKEAALTLNKYQPSTMGQAGRLAGVNPTDLMVVSIALGKREAVGV